MNTSAKKKNDKIRKLLISHILWLFNDNYAHIIKKNWNKM